MSWRRRFQRARRPIALGMVATAAGLLLLPAMASAQDVRTETDLFGYNVKAMGSPLSVLFYESFIPLPVAPGEAQFEMTTAFTRTNLGLGPQAVAVSSNFWPGSPVGDGYGTVNCGMQATFAEFLPLPEQECDDSTGYPYEARASYPGNSEADWNASQTTPPGMTGAPPSMMASAEGLDVRARAQFNPGANGAEALVEFGAMTSDATSVVTETEAIATASAQVADLSLLGGIITIEEVETRLEARSDGAAGDTWGETTFTGLRIFGQPVAVTEDGLRLQPAGDDDTGIGSGLGQVAGPLDEELGPLDDAIRSIIAGSAENDPQSVLGIGFSPAQHEVEVDGAVARRSTHGVRLTVDVPVLQGYLAPLYDGYGQLVDGVPDEFGPLKGYLIELGGLNPIVEFVFGRAAVTAGASPGFTFTPPSFTPPPFTPPAAPTTPVEPGFGASLPPAAVTVPPPATPPGLTPGPTVAPPVSPAPPLTPSAYEPPRFDDLPLAMAGVILLMLAAPTWGLRTLRERAIGAASVAHVPNPLPDLRGGPR